MAVIESTNDDLRNFVYNKKYVVVKFYTETHCPVCEKLIIEFEQLSKAYDNITFVSMNAEDNPVAKQLILQEKKPFVGIYKEGLLLECKIVSAKNEISTMIERLPNINIDL